MHNPHHGIISFINVCDHFTDKHHCWWKLKYIQGMPQSISRVINDYGRWYSGRSSMAYWKEKDQNGTAGGDYLNTRIRYSWTMPLYKSSLVSVRVHEEVLDGSWHCRIDQARTWHARSAKSLIVLSCVGRSLGPDEWILHMNLQCVHMFLFLKYTMLWHVEQANYFFKRNRPSKLLVHFKIK